MTELPKTFDPGAIEARWYAHWEGEGLFRPERNDAEPLHHRQSAAQRHRQPAYRPRARQHAAGRAGPPRGLLGKDALWVVGTDHAGIATQMVVERNLNSQGVKRTDMSREAFVEHVWEWKAQSGGQITRQLRRLGCSMDWSREQFTMDPHFSRAVIKVFVDLYNQGLLYRDKRLVNWDPASRPRSRISRSRPARSTASSGISAIRSPTAAAMSRSRRRGPRRCWPTWRWR